MGTHERSGWDGMGRLRIVRIVATNALDVLDWHGCARGDGTIAQDGIRMVWSR
jgi:hypothetical protein